MDCVAWCHQNKLRWHCGTAGGHGRSAAQYPGLQLDCVYRKGQNRIYFLRRLVSFNVCSKLFHMFNQSMESSVWSYAVRHKKRLGRIIHRAVEMVLEQRTIARLKAFLKNTTTLCIKPSHQQRSSFSCRLRSLRYQDVQ